VLALEDPGHPHPARLLAVAGVARASRKLNLDMMRKVAAVNWKTHCFGLADEIFSHR
jgi:hypothetical protein